MQPSKRPRLPMRRHNSDETQSIELFAWSAPTDQSPTNYHHRPDLHSTVLAGGPNGRLKRTFEQFAADKQEAAARPYIHPTGESWTPPNVTSDQDVRMTEAPSLPKLTTVSFSPPANQPLPSIRRSSPSAAVHKPKSILKKRMAVYETLPDDYKPDSPFEYDVSDYVLWRENENKGSATSPPLNISPLRIQLKPVNGLVKPFKPVPSAPVPVNPLRLPPPPPSRDLIPLVPRRISPVRPAPTLLYPELKANFERPTHPSVPAPKADQRPVRRIGGFFVKAFAYTLQKIYNATIGHIFGYVEPPYDEIVAVETDTSGRKRRAIVATDLDSNTPSTQLDDAEVHWDNMPGLFPTDEPEKAAPQEEQSVNVAQNAPKPLETPPESQTDSSGGEEEAPKPADSSSGEEEVPKPDDSSSGDEKAPKTVQPHQQSNTKNKKEPFKLPPTVRNPTLHATNLEDIHEEARSRLRIPQQYLPPTIPTYDSGLRNLNLSGSMRPQLRPRPRGASYYQEQSKERDANVDALITRTREVTLKAKKNRSVQSLRSSYRTTKLRSSQFDEKRSIPDFKEEAKREIELQTEELRKQVEAEKVREAAEEAERRKKAEQEAQEAGARQKLKNKLIRDLDPEWGVRVETAMAAANPKQVIATTPDGLEITRYDVGKVLPQSNEFRMAGDGRSGGPLGWLNDEIVNSLIGMIVTRNKEQTGYVKGPNSVPEMEMYASQWFTTYKNKGISGIKSWSRRKGISGEKLLRAKKIFFPINTGAHWKLLIISPAERTIELLDSASSGGGAKYFRIAREWLHMELGGARYVADEWTDSSSSVSSFQLNSDDCGVFTCMNALASAKGRAFADVTAVDKMLPARRMMVAVLLNGGFKGDWEL